MQKLLAKIFGTSHQREMKKIQPIVDQINRLEPEMQNLSDEQLKNKSKDFQERLKKGESVNDILPEAFAVCREASKRVLGMRHYDVQLIGGIVLNRVSNVLLNKFGAQAFGFLTKDEPISLLKTGFVNGFFHLIFNKKYSICFRYCAEPFGVIFVVAPG